MVRSIGRYRVDSAELTRFRRGPIRVDSRYRGESKKNLKSRVISADNADTADTSRDTAEMTRATMVEFLGIFGYSQPTPVASFFLSGPFRP